MPINYSGGAPGKTLQTDSGILYEYSASSSSWEVARGRLQPDVEIRGIKAIEAQLRANENIRALQISGPVRLQVDIANGKSNPDVFLGESFSNLQGALAWVASTKGLSGLELEIIVGPGTYSWSTQESYDLSEIGSLRIVSKSGMWFDWDNANERILLNVTGGTLSTAPTRGRTTCSQIASDSRYGSRIQVGADAQLRIIGLRRLEIVGLQFTGGGVISDDAFLFIETSNSFTLQSVMTTGFNGKPLLVTREIDKFKVIQSALIGFGEQPLNITRVKSVEISTSLIGSSTGETMLQLVAERISLHQCIIVGAEIGAAIEGSSTYLSNCLVVGNHQGLALNCGDFYLTQTLITRNVFLGLRGAGSNITAYDSQLSRNGRTLQVYACRTYLERVEMVDNEGWQTAAVSIVSGGRASFRDCLLENNTRGVVTVLGGAVINAAGTTGSNSASTSNFSPNIGVSSISANSGAWRASNSI